MGPGGERSDSIPDFSIPEEYFSSTLPLSGRGFVSGNSRDLIQFFTFSLGTCFGADAHNIPLGGYSCLSFPGIFLLN